MDYYLSVLQKYVVFSGRAGRREFWYFALFNFLAVCILEIVGSVIGGLVGAGHTLGSGLALLYDLAVLLPALGVSIRRLHDTGRSGWWLFISFVPLIGSLVLLVFFIQDSQPSENQYGPNPKSVVIAITEIA
jgi:uncharacterized membrane protein YhaH (DUF805 family)